MWKMSVLLSHARCGRQRRLREEAGFMARVRVDFRSLTLFEDEESGSTHMAMYATIKDSGGATLSQFKRHYPHPMLPSLRATLAIAAGFVVWFSVATVGHSLASPELRRSGEGDEFLRGNASCSSRGRRSRIARCWRRVRRHCPERSSGHLHLCAAASGAVRAGSCLAMG